jgi:hypothetical protein
MPEETLDIDAVADPAPPEPTAPAAPPAKQLEPTTLLKLKNGTKVNLAFPIRAIMALKALPEAIDLEQVVKSKETLLALYQSPDLYTVAIEGMKDDFGKFAEGRGPEQIVGLPLHRRNDIMNAVCTACRESFVDPDAKPADPNSPTVQ